MLNRFLSITFAGLLFMLLVSSLNAHEPLFGFGPELIRKGGYAIESEFEYERVGDERETTFETDVMYGVNEYLALSATMPFFINKQEKDELTGEKISSSGLGKIETRAKLLIYKDYLYGKRDQIVVIGGIRWPTVGLQKKPFLENRALDFIVALAAGREMLRNSYFGTLTYNIKIQDHQRKDGDEVLLTFAAGFRPEPISYYKLDWLFFLEFDAIFSMKDSVLGKRDPNSGGYVFFIGPTVFVSKRNVLFKAGIQAPMLEHLNGEQARHDYRIAVGLDLHF